MIVPINATDPTGNRKITSLGNFTELTWILLRVVGAATIYLASQAGELAASPPVASGASSTGIPIQSGDGLVSFPWIGELYCIADVDLAFIVIEYPNKGAY